MTDKLTTKVIGFRFWRLVDGELHPSNGAFPAWRVGENRAVCEKDKFRVGALLSFYASSSGAQEKKPEPPKNHTAPHPDCDCGYYAWHSLDRISSEAPHDGIIHGAVAAWGNVEVHHDGFRAEYAQPVAFGWSDSYTLRSYRAAEEFARKHGIRFVPLEELPEFGAVFGEPVPEDLRPEAPPESPFSFRANIIGSHWHHATPISLSGSLYWRTSDKDVDADGGESDHPVDKARKKYTEPLEHTRKDKRKRPNA